MATDDYSRAGWGWSLTSKAQAFTNIRNLHSLLKVQTGGMSMRRLRFDRGMEFLKEEMQEWIKTEGIHSEPTALYWPHQNGVVERANRTVIERMRATFIETDLPKKLWPLVFDVTLYVKNRTPTLAISNSLLPIIYWTNKKPDLSHRHPIKCAAIYKIPDAKRVKSEKFEAVGAKCRFLGYEGTNFRLWDSEKVIVSSDVEFPLQRAKKFKEQDQTPFVEPQVDELDCISVDLAKAYQPERRFPGVSLDEVDADHVDVADNTPSILPISSPPPIRDYVSDPRPVRHRQPPTRLREEQAEALKNSSLLSAFPTDVIDPPADLPERYCHLIIPDPSVSASYMAAKESSPHPLSGTPLTHEQAMSSPEADFWKRAEEIEVSGLDAKNTWTVVGLFRLIHPSVFLILQSSLAQSERNFDAAAGDFRPGTI